MLITGESGVGKTALVRGFVQDLTAERSASRLNEADVIELDVEALGAGVSYKGEADDRLRAVLSALGEERTILVVEGIDKLFDKQGMLYGCASLLKQEMLRGRVMVLCTASIDGFTKNLETDKEFCARVDHLKLDAPTGEQCYRIVEGGVEEYRAFHRLDIGEAAMREAIRLAARYLPEKAMPASVFGLIDRTMAQIGVMNDTTAGQLADLRARLDAIEGDGDDALQALTWLHYELTHRVSCLLTAQLDDSVDPAKMATAAERRDYLRQCLDKMESLSSTKRTAVEPSDLSAVVARQTGIPMGKVQSKERDRLESGEAMLKQRVVGQDHAIRVVLDAIYESRSGLNKRGQPMGSFFFLGPTGTGKTELSKALVQYLFGDESALIRFDMSEFKEEHSVALLYGAPPGYVGYEEGGLLVNKIRQKPYSVVLFDEIEKAHKSVFDLFLQILDEGKLHDRLGRVGDFSNALILFTSNIASRQIAAQFEQGQVPAANELMTIMQDHFRPEFLGRLTEIVPFAPITEQTVVKIFGIHLNNLRKQLAEQNISLEIDDESLRAVAMTGYSPQYGARPIIGAIRKEIRRPLSKLIIGGTVRPGDRVTARWDGDRLAFESARG